MRYMWKSSWYCRFDVDILIIRHVVVFKPLPTPHVFSSLASRGLRTGRYQLRVTRKPVPTPVQCRCGHHFVYGFYAHSVPTQWELETAVSFGEIDSTVVASTASSKFILNCYGNQVIFYSIDTAFVCHYFTY